MRSAQFSIVVPTYARLDRLARCLDSLIRLDYPTAQFEVVVVDDGSPAPAHEAVAPFRDRLDLTVIRQNNSGPAAARNAGAEVAKYEFLAFTDDDCTPEPGWLAGFNRALADHSDALLGGTVVNALADNSYATASQCIVDFLYRYYGADRGEAPFFTSNNMAVSKSRFLAVGGFDETFPLAAAEDREFGMRWRDRLGNLTFVPDAIVRHAHALTLRRFFHQHSNYGRGARHLATVMQRRGSLPRRIEPPRFYVGLIACPLTYDTSGRAVLECGLILLSQVAMVWGYLDQRRSTRRVLGDFQDV